MDPEHSKNLRILGISAASSIAAGYAGAELSDLVSHSASIDIASSTICSYVGGMAAFIPTYVNENAKEFYDASNNFKTQSFVSNFGKIALGFAALQFLYLLTKPVITYTFQKYGFDPGPSSLIADTLSLSAYYLIAFRMMCSIDKAD